jgi:hypothetical protein
MPRDSLATQVVRLYADRGYQVRGSGMHGPLGECMALWHENRRMDTGLGMSVQELGVWERLAENWSPRAIFGIGNGFGWSTVALSLIWPRAAIVVLDAETEGGDNRAANQLTRDILGGGLIVRGASPQFVPNAMTVLGAKPEFVFIDATHTNPAQDADWAAVKPYLAAEHVVFFHDVGLLELQESFWRCAEGYGDQVRILSTTTGMGAVWTPNIRVEW